MNLNKSNVYRNPTNYPDPGLDVQATGSRKPVTGQKAALARGAGVATKKFGTAESVWFPDSQPLDEAAAQLFPVAPCVAEVLAGVRQGTT